jgi:prolyl oligopeptidase
MRVFIASALSLVLASACGSNGPDVVEPNGRAPAFAYPDTPRGEVVDDYHGTKVADPYRWLEDADSADTAAWVAAQNKVTFGYLESIPERAALEQRLTTLWNYEKYNVPKAIGGRYFYTRNDGLQNQSVLYWAASLDAEPTVLLDPNAMSEDGTVALSRYSISNDGSLIAYGLQSAGSDWQEWHVKRVDTGEDLTDHLKWVKFSSAEWAHDGTGFYYARYPEPKGEELKSANYYQKLYYHRLGTPQSDDVVVFERPDEKKWGFSPTVTQDGRYLIVSVWKGTGEDSLIFAKDLSAEGSQFVPLITEWKAEFDFIDSIDSTLLFKSDMDAPLGKVIAIDFADPAEANWKTVIAESEDTLSGVTTVGTTIFANYMHDAKSVARIFGIDGAKLGEVELPGIGSARGFGGHRGDTETFYSFSSFTSPTTIYRYDLTTSTSSVFRAPTVDFDADQYVIEQVFYASKDGTKVPMFVTHKKGMKLDGTNPTFLYGYGGFNASMTPYFSVANAVWLELGGVVAIPALRGGGEYGEQWHQQGIKLDKQNVFDDFIAAAEWLISNKYTQSSKLAIAGGSNGGLLVGAAMTQRPELFGAALPAVGVMDMLRFHKFTIGWAWVDDYGSSDDPDEFAALYAYSPYHNLKSGVRYPSTMVTTADHDDRVVPGHSFKFAAALQAAHAGDNPVVIRIQTKAGHGAGKPTSMRIAEKADQWAFLVDQLQIDYGN